MTPEGWGTAGCGGPRPASPLHQELWRALARGGTALDALADGQPADRRDAALALACIHDLHLAPLAQVGPAARWQHHPAVAALKARLESGLLGDLGDLGGQGGAGDPDQADPADPADLPGPAATVAEVRALAARDLVPPVYDWLAEEASLGELRHFLAHEGGPDGGFDDLVALCQVGLDGRAKVELAANYWDEMGRGDPEAVHTALHRRLSRALDLAPPRREDLPLPVLARSLLGTTLATNRWLQPELVGALGLVELQAGPRCRRVVRALRRLGAPEGALPFYEEHAVADPRHGKAWLDEVIAPLAADPAVARGIVRGARWRAAANDGFYAWADRRHRPAALAAVS